MAYNVDRQFPIKKSPPDSRDFRLTALMLPQVLNEEKINSMYCGPVYEQGTYGFCWGNAAIAFANWLYNKHRAGSQHQLSPLFLIQQVKNSTYADYPTTEGDTIRAAMKGLQKSGSVAEVRYPYDLYEGGLAFRVPSDELNKISERFRIGPYAGVLTLDEITTALSLGNAVLAGVMWTDRFRQGYQLDFPFGTAIGGHAILLLDNYPNKTLFGRTGWIKFQNSWGTDWGESGFGWISHDYLRQRVDGNGAPYYIDGFTANYSESAVPTFETEWHINDNIVKFDDIPYTLDQPPVIDTQTGRTLTPTRATLEGLGHKVTWEPITQTITSKR